MIAGWNKVEHESPDKIKGDITTAYARGKINELQHEILKGEIYQYHQKILSDTISLLNVPDKDTDQYIQALDKARERIKDAHTEGKVTNGYYADLKNEISVLYEETYSRRLDSLTGQPIRHVYKDDRLIDKIRSDMENAFAKGKISDQHYNMLNKKIDSLVNTNDNKDSNK